MKDLIMLHGVGLDRGLWQPLRQALPDVTTHAYDLRGHGQGPDWKGPANLDGFTDDLWDFADALGLDSFALCGFSMGAMIAQWAALTKPERISHLVLLSGVYGRSEQQQDAVIRRYKEAELRGPTELIEAALTRWFPAEFAEENPEYLTQIRLRLSQNNTEQFMQNYKFFAHEGAQIVGRLNEIQVPTLVATGGLDTGSTPEMAKRMASKIPSAKAIIFKDTAHMLPMQKPFELARLIKGVLQK
ncbi:MAG: alpha/beta fold hydrolase [Amylibacter sp.]|nr:alpha/beta fold hydrolase [Amylibacter sp.]